MNPRASSRLLRPSAFAIAMLTILAACEGGGSRGGEPWTNGDIEFRGEQPFLPGLELDTGWLPDASPVAVRTTVTASGGVTVLALASSDGMQLDPIAGSGSLAVEGALALEVSARIDTSGISFEDVVHSFSYEIAAEQIDFDPFALDAPVSITSTLPAAELGAVPIPSVPGSTLVLSVTGGELTTSFQGSCAQARDGFGQYTGTLTTTGTVACAATIELEIPIVGTQSFGPFPFDLPIPPIATPTDLGTRSLATGEPAEAMGTCDETSTGSGSGSDDSVADTGASDSDATSSGDTTGDDVADATGTNPTDPSYPPPVDGECAPDEFPVSFDGPTNGVCLAPCAEDGWCPSGLTGDAIAECLLNPGSSNVECVSETDCTNGTGPEVCNAQLGVCTLPPTHCVLTCNGAHLCPDGMDCVSGSCTYVL